MKLGANTLRQITWLLGLLLSVTGGLHAQLRVGAPAPGQPVHPGASLQIQAGPYADSTYRGLLLPRVKLISYAEWSLAGTPVDGMLVFNLATTPGSYAVSPGLYAWYNVQWNRLTTLTTPALITVLDCAPDLPAQGAYLAGVTLTGENTKSVRVTPRSAGEFTARTGIENGFSFSGSATFTAQQVGSPQLLVMAASGTPRATGLTSFTLTAAEQTCSFEVNVQAYIDCSGPLKGVYKVGQPLDASNTKQLTLVPRSAGEHFVSIIVYNPDLMNYLVFTQRFTVTVDQVGIPQTLVLTGSGTPKVSGNFPATVQVFVNSEVVGRCSFLLTIAP